VIRIDVVTGFPRLLEAPLNESMMKRAQAQGMAEIHLHDLRDFAEDRHKTIDDVPFGGGAGMVLKPEPIFRCIEALRAERTYDDIIYLTADGERFDQAKATELSLQRNLLLLCGHYKGIDERIREHLITRELSIGDYVLTGGEPAAVVVIDAIVRLIPGVLHDGVSLLDDSFQNGLLGAPTYTRPAMFRDMPVPEILLSGNHREIEEWKREQQRLRTTRRRRDMNSDTDAENNHGQTEAR
jgi:tRNA (guanine37-N1)-methyltransferase